MGLLDDLKANTQTVFASRWVVEKATVVPEPKDLQLANHGKVFRATALYADLAESTAMVDAQSAEFAGEVYKAYLYCAARLIHAEQGDVTAYDGDRIMGLFLGASRSDRAVRVGLKLNWLCKNVIAPRIVTQYPKKTFSLKQTVGIDTSDLMAARTGARGANDLVWIGRAANYAAKLSGLSAEFPTWITGAVFDELSLDLRLSNGQAMWEERVWTAMGNHRIYRSHWTHTVS